MTTKRQAGFTLFEAIVSIVIVATIGYVLSQTFNIGVRNYFFGAEVEQVDLFAWAVTNRGALQTVRFDDAEQLITGWQQQDGWAKAADS